MSNIRFYLMCAGMIAFLMLELVGVYWMQTGAPPPFLVGVSPTVLGWSATIGLCGVMGALLWDA